MDYGTLFGNTGASDLTAEEQMMVDNLVANVANTELTGNTGAIGFDLGALMTAPLNLLQQLGVPGLQAQKMAPHVAKAAAAAVAPKALHPALARPHPAALAVHAPIHAPMHAPIHIPSHVIHHHPPQVMPPARILTDEELFSRIEIRQFASMELKGLSANTTDANRELEVTRNGTILDWHVADSSDDIVAQSLTFLQDPYVIFRACSLGAWASKSAHRRAVQPLHVTAPNKFKVTLINPTSAEITPVWEMWGIDDEAIHKYAADPEIMRTLASKGIAMAAMLNSGIMSGR